jgi:lipopolysaccharide/colanic/teichoic acid biosynthesis glycosyltransferase
MTYSTKTNDGKLNNYSTTYNTVSTKFLFVKRNKNIDLQQPDEFDCFNSVNNFEEAKSVIKNVYLPHHLPELLIIDIPFTLTDLKFFKIWLSENFTGPIPIIYCGSKLTPFETKKLFQLGLIDDVIKNDYDSNLLENKAKFFKTLYAKQSNKENNELLPTKKIPVKNSNPLYSKFIKRALDVFISLSLLILLLPLLIIIGIIVKLTSEGPVIYVSKRAGKGFKIFNFYKFRTMVLNAEKKTESLKEQNIYISAKGDPYFFKISNDPRITKIGVFLRNTSLDELPQLLNVLKGDMSIVGNRPLPLYEASTLTTNDYAERFMAPAGITGLWQISKRGRPEMSTEERISLDIEYARNSSTKRDLKILFKTPSALIQKQNQ